MNKLKLKRIVLFTIIISAIIFISVSISNRLPSLRVSFNDEKIIEKIVRYDFKNKVVVYIQNDICGVCVLALLEKINKMELQYKNSLVFVVDEEWQKNLLELHLKNIEYSPMIIVKMFNYINNSFISYYSKKENHLFFEVINLNTNLDFMVGNGF
ncbi:MAG: hypothetical protein RDU14_17815 [Melioribacteraceae bacterium]|nr:hypothetical protein [Melioribacteraceae bacterium]